MTVTDSDTPRPVDTPTHDRFGFPVPTDPSQLCQGPDDILTQYRQTMIPEGNPQRAVNAACGLNEYGNPIEGATLTPWAQHIVDSQGKPQPVPSIVTTVGAPKGEVPAAIAVNHDTGLIAIVPENGEHITLPAPENWPEHAWHALLAFLHIR